MFESTQQTLHDEMGLNGVEYIRAALNPEQVQRFRLPHNPDAVKVLDRRTPAYIRQYGEIAVEVDALHPKTSQEMVINAIEAQFDMELFHQQKEIEKQELAQLAGVKQQVQELLKKCLTSQT